MDRGAKEVRNASTQARELRNASTQATLLVDASTQVKSEEFGQGVKEVSNASTQAISTVKRISRERGTQTEHYYATCDSWMNGPKQRVQHLTGEPHRQRVLEALTHWHNHGLALSWITSDCSMNLA